MNNMYSAIAKYIIGEEKELKIKATPEKIDAIVNVTNASKALFEALESNKDVNLIKALIDKKNTAANNFTNVMGKEFVWPF